MVDNADLQLARRKIRDRSVALLLVGVVLLMPPMVRIAQIDTTVFGLPFALVYLFSVWGLLVIGGALLVLGTLVAIMGMVADLVGANRKLMEENLARTRKLEDMLAEMQRERAVDVPAPAKPRRRDAA